MSKLTKKEIPVEILPYYSKLKLPEQRKEFLQLFTYFHGMCESMEIQIVESDYENLIDNGVFISKKEINRFIFDKIKNNKLFIEKLPEKNILSLSKDDLDKINNFSGESEQSRQIKRQIADVKYNINNLVTSLESHTKNIFLLNKRLESLIKNKEISIKVSNEFDQIIRSDQFTYIYFDSFKMQFHAVTKNNCILEYKDSKINFGKFDLVYDLKKNIYYYMPYSDNIIYDSRYIHPHVYENHKMCYGTALASATECMETFDIAKIYSISSMILHNFNPDSPIVNFQSFANEGVSIVINPVTHINALLTQNGSAPFLHKNIGSILFPETYNDYYIKTYIKEVASSSEITENSNEEKVA